MTGPINILNQFLLLLALFTSSGLIAQQPAPAHIQDSFKLITPFTTNICSNDVILTRLRKDPAYVALEEKMNKEILKASQTLVGDTITLPVVIHIINPNPGSITDLQVINGVNDLNDAFSKSGAYAASLGVDTKIRFCLSQKDPDGGNTTGITRTTSFFSTNMNMDIEDAKLKNLIQWNPSRYINIWLITSIDAEAYADFICGNWYRLGVGGYATLPPGGGSLDGIVITGFGKLLAHEMGHYLGLYHTFQGGCFNNNCLTDGDRVCDTPPDNSVRPSGPCNSPSNTCNTDTLSAYSNGNFPIDVPDQISNFMDYGNTACSNRFTQGQADRMRAAIITQRSGLLQDECTKPCNENILAGFTRDIAYPIPGNLITFTNNSPATTNYEWLINDIVVATSTNFSYTFSAVGKYKVTLKAFNSSNCFASYTDYIILTCGTTARFYTNKKTIASKINIYTDSILFTNNSYNAQTYQWLMSNNAGMTEQVINTTSSSFYYVFPTPATYFVRLIATNGNCSDTSGVYSIPVLDPTADAVPFGVTLFCYQQNKIRIRFCIADFGFAPIQINTPVNFYDADPRLPGANRLSPGFFLPSAIPGGNCSNCFTHILNVAYSGIERIYIVVNDLGTSIPVLLPNTSFVERNYFNNFQNSLSNRTIINASICQGQNYAGYTASGTYIDTLPSIKNGCDSIRTLNLTVKPVFATTINASICQGQNYAGHTTTGTFVDVYTAANGCDSTRTLNLIVKPVFFTTVNASICQGQNYAGHSTTGTYVDVYSAKNGCDSTRTLNLTVKPKFITSYTISICQGQNYYGHTTSGTYVDSYFAMNGCDSTRTVQLTVLPTFNTTVSATICAGENYAGHTSSGTFVDIYSATNGCDSTRTLSLTVNPVKFTTINASICQGENYAGHTSSGTYVDVYNTSAGCDSTRTLILTVKPLISSNITTTICEGANYAGHTTAGIYIDVYKAVNGCDSTRTLQLNVNPKKFTFFNPEICEGQSYFVSGKLQTTTGVYYDTTLTYLGCDSILVTNLTVNPLPQPNLDEDRGICISSVLVLNPGNFTSYLWQDGSTNNSYTTNLVGDYSVTVINSFGCKASDTMRLLTIYPLPTNFLPADSNLCKGNILQVKPKGFTNHNWSTGSNQPSIDITNNGTYSLQATDKNGCTGTDSMKVFFYDNCIIIQIPDAFTPNQDGKNDLFKPLLSAPVNNYLFQIWNRWGQLVFETQTAEKGWDGLLQSIPQPTGAFVYLISFKDYLGRNIKKPGTVVLIR